MKYELFFFKRPKKNPIFYVLNEGVQTFDFLITIDILIKTLFAIEYHKWLAACFTYNLINTVILCRFSPVYPFAGHKQDKDIA